MTFKRRVAKEFKVSTCQIETHDGSSIGRTDVEVKLSDAESVREALEKIDGPKCGRSCPSKRHPPL